MFSRQSSKLRPCYPLSLPFCDPLLLLKSSRVPLHQPQESIYFLFVQVRVFPVKLQPLVLLSKLRIAFNLLLQLADGFEIGFFQLLIMGSRLMAKDRFAGGRSYPEVASPTRCSPISPFVSLTFSFR